MGIKDQGNMITCSLTIFHKHLHLIPNRNTGYKGVIIFDTKLCIKHGNQKQKHKNWN